MQDVAVVIPCRNEARTIEAVLDALAAQTCTPGLAIVVDDGSSDGTAAVVEAWARVHPVPAVSILATPPRGTAAALNAGISAAPARIIIRLDGHCRPEPGYVAGCLAMLAGRHVGLVGGVWSIVPGGETLTARAIAAALSHPLAAGDAAYRLARRGPPRPVDTVPFGAFRRTLWTELGGFDEALLRNQDYDFNYRVRGRGLEVMLDPAIKTAYVARPTLSALARQYLQYGYWKIAMLRKYPSAIRLRQVPPLVLCPLLALLGWAALTGSVPALVLLAGYLGLNAAGASHVAWRGRDARLWLPASAALCTVQIAWSAGAWLSLLTGTRAIRA